MAEKEAGQQPIEPRRTVGQSAKRAFFFVLFGTILVIPRIRRLRRRVWAWTLVRLAGVVCGGWFIWRFVHAQGGKGMVAVGVLMLAFSLFVRAKPALRSTDDVAKELGALVALNGGAFLPAHNDSLVEHTQIFVHPERLIVVSPGERRLADIPLASIRSLEAIAVATRHAKGGAAWEVQVNWGIPEPRTTVFRYEGPFAEHLARIAESTVRSQWKKGLPIIPA